MHDEDEATNGFDGVRVRELPFSSMVLLPVCMTCLLRDWWYSSGWLIFTQLQFVIIHLSNFYSNSSKLVAVKNVRGFICLTLFLRNNLETYALYHCSKISKSWFYKPDFHYRRLVEPNVKMTDHDFLVSFLF